MLTKISNFLVPFCPFLTSSMSQKGKLSKQSADADMNCQKQFESQIKILSHQPEQRKLKERN